MNIQAKIDEARGAIIALQQQRDRFVVQANQQVADMNTEIARREGAITVLLEIQAEAAQA